MQLNGSTVLVTGASSGIGAATARAAARAGARVLLLARTQAALAQVAADIAAAGGTALAYPVDLSDAGAVAATAGAITAAVGTPDLIINSAGAGRWLYTEETSPAEAVAMMAAPYFAAFFVTRAFLPDMLRRGSGHIVNIGSPASYRPWPGAAAYTAARWALHGFTEALRTDLRGTGVRVTFVVPGYVSSPYFDHNPGSRERMPRLGRLIPPITPETCAAALLRGVAANRRVVMVPFALRLVYWFDRLAPGLSEWLIIRTGWQRHGGSR